MGTMMLNGRPYGNTSMGNQEYSETELWSGNITQGSGVLSEPLTAYDAIIIFGSGYYSSSDGNTLIITELIPTNELNYNQTYLLNANSGQDRRIFIAFSDATHFSINYYGSDNCNIHKILGIKYATGGTVVEANPKGIPTRMLDTVKINNHVYKVQSGDNIYGTFIDTNRVIQAERSVGSSDTYTATQDCMVVILLPIGNHNTYVYIDGVKVINISGMTNIYYDYTTIPLKEGQVMTFDFGSTSGYITVYGLTFGSNNIFTPQIYSLEERCVGVWKDNKPLYQKTFVGTTDNRQYFIPNTSYIETLVSANGYMSESEWDYELPFNDGSDFISVTNNETNGARLYTSSYFVGFPFVVTLQYTKKTDVPGSGQYNTLGVPTVHYSTDEQVIGTDYDGKPIYQKTYTNLGTINSSTNIDLQLSNISWITVDSANSSLSNCIPFPYIHPNTNNVVGCFFDMNGGSPIINCRAGSDASGTFTLDKLTVRYKKTTD